MRRRRRGRMLREWRRGRVQRMLAAATALSALPLGAEIYFEHFRGSFGDKWMWTPVALSPALTAAGVAGIGSRRAAQTSATATISNAPGAARYAGVCPFSAMNPKPTRAP